MSTNTLLVSCKDGSSRNTCVTYDGVKIELISKMETSVEANNDWHATLHLEVLDFLVGVELKNCKAVFDKRTEGALEKFPPSMLRELGQKLLNMAAIKAQNEIEAKEKPKD